MQDNNKMETMVEALNNLTKKGYDTQFKIKEGKLTCLECDKSYGPKDVKIDEFFRYEGETDPGQMAIVYAICTNDNMKGTIVNGYGTYSESEVDEFMKKVLEVHKGEIY